jgi:hypothetical protein
MTSKRFIPFIKIFLVSILITPVLHAQPYTTNQADYMDFILLKNEDVISCSIVKFYRNTVVFNKQESNQSAALFAVKVIRLQDLGVVYNDIKGFIYSVDSLNLYLANRYDIPFESIPVVIEKDGKSVVKQDPGKFEFSIASGFLGTGEWLNIFRDIVTVFGTLGHVTTEEYDRLQILLSYHYFLPGRNLAMGLDFAYEKYSEHVLVDDKKAGTLKTSYTTFAFAVSYNWYNTESIQLYSAAGLGIMFIAYENKKPVLVDLSSNILPNFNLTLIGFKVGHKLYLLGELGGGYRGLANIGIAYQF